MHLHRFPLTAYWRTRLSCTKRHGTFGRRHDHQEPHKGIPKWGWGRLGSVPGTP